jgi:hypothetical protein
MLGELLAYRWAKGVAQPVLTDVLPFFENRKLVVSQPLRDAQVVAESSHPWGPCISVWRTLVSLAGWALR